MRVLLFSRKFGKEAALSAGLRVSRGDAVLLMIRRATIPPALPGVLEKWREVMRWSSVSAAREKRCSNGGKRLYTGALDRSSIVIRRMPSTLVCSPNVSMRNAMPERSAHERHVCLGWVPTLKIPLPPPRGRGTIKSADPLFKLG